ANTSFVRWIASLPKKLRDPAIRNLPDDKAQRVKSEIEYDWWEDARPEQKPPEGEWRIWLLLAGRGFGKTRTGAEYVRAMVESRQARRIALVAPTALDARSIMVEGESGLLSIGSPQ